MALTSRSSFTNCMCVTSCVISWHYHPSLITNGVPTLISYETAQRGPMGNFQLAFCAQSILQHIRYFCLERTASLFCVISQKKKKKNGRCFFPPPFLKMCCNNRLLCSMKPISCKARGFFREREKKERTLSAVCSAAPYLCSLVKIPLSPSTSISPLITGEMMCQSLQTIEPLALGIAGTLNLHRLGA